VPDVIVVIPSAQERHALPTRMMIMRRRIVDIFMNCGYQKMQTEIIL